MNFEKSYLGDSQERTLGAAEWVAHIHQFILYHAATFMPGPYHVMPPNIKAQIPLLFNDNHSVKDICHILGIKKSLVHRTLSLYSKYGTITNPSRYSHSIGRCRLLSSADIAFISTIVQHHNTIYLDELQCELWAKRHKFATLSNLLRTLQRLCITWKVVSSSAAERNEERRAIYMNHIAAEVLDSNMFVFIDEAAGDKRTSTHQHGWSMRGVRCCVNKCFVRGTRFSILPAITLDGIVAYDIIEGPVNSQRFVRFLEEHVVHLCGFRCAVSTYL